MILSRKGRKARFQNANPRQNSRKRFSRASKYYSNFHMEKNRYERNKKHKKLPKKIIFRGKISRERGIQFPQTPLTRKFCHAIIFRVMGIFAMKQSF